MFDWSMIVAIAVAALGTSLLGGAFGMIGGLILMGVLLLFLPVPAAMTLHAISTEGGELLDQQRAPNCWRAVVWHRHIMWRILLGYLLGNAIMFGLLAWAQFSPPKAWVYFRLGSCHSRPA